MPLIDQDTTEQTILDSITVSPPNQAQFQDESKSSPTLAQTFSAGIRQNSNIFSYFTRETGLPNWASGIDMDFDPSPFLEENDDIRDYGYASSEADVRVIKKQLEQETADRQVLNESGVSGIFAGLAGDILDPTMLLPAPAIFKGVKTAQGIVKSSLTAGASIGAAVAVQEGGLQQTQLSRPKEESLLNIGTATIFGAFLGGAGTAFLSANKGTPQFQKGFDELQEDFSTKLSSDYEFPDQAVGDSSVGAAQFKGVTSEQLTPSSTFGIGDAISRLPVFGDDAGKWDLFNTPDMRILYDSNDIPTAKQTVLEAVGTPLSLKGADDGTFTVPVSSMHRIKQNQVDFALPSHNALDKAKQAHKQNPKAERLKEHEFNSRVYQAVRNQGKGELDENIASAAKVIEERFAKITDQLEDLDRGYLKFDDGRAYIPQIMNPKAVKKNSFGFQDIVERQFKRTAQREGSELLAEELADAASLLTQKLEGYPDLRDIHEAVDELFARAPNQGTASSLKQRRIDWDDDLFQELVDGGYIETRMDRVIDQYARTVIADLDVAKTFGDLTGEKRIKEIFEKDYKPKLNKINNQIKALDSGKEKDIDRAFDGEKAVSRSSLEKRRAKINKNFAQVKTDVDAIIKRLTGRYQLNGDMMQGKRFAQDFRNFNTLRFMGDVMASSMPDVPRIFLTQASLPVFGSSLKKLITKLPKGTATRKEFLEEANALSVSLNGVMQGRAHKLAEVSDEIYAGNSRGFSEKLDDFTSNFFHHTGMNWWNDTWQGVASELTATNIANVAARLGTEAAKKGDVSKLANAGVTKESAKVITQQIALHGKKEGSLIRPGLSDWDITDPKIKEAYTQYKAAVQREVETIIIEPGGDKPVFMSRDMGKALGQFKSFGYASLQRSTLLYAQRFRKNPADLALWTAFMGQISLGIVTTAVKLATSPKGLAVAGGWTVGQWIAEGVDRSGMLGSLTDNYNVVTAITGGATNTLTDKVEGIYGEENSIKPLSRYQVRNQFDRMFGPSFGTLKDVGDVANMGAAMVTGETPTQNELKALRRLTPYQNYFAWKGFLNQGQENLFEELDIPKSR